jgi:tetratricopeptide (TPR) repeat protein
MKTWTKVVTALIAVEILMGGLLLWRRSQRIEPPVPDFGKVDSETAEGLLSLSRRAHGGHHVRWRNLAEGYLGTGYYSAAEQCFRQAHTLNSEDLRSAYGLGFCLERTGNTAEAIRVLSGIAESPEADTELRRTCWYQVGRCYLREENPKAAEEAFRRAPEFSPAVYQLCKLLIRTERAEEAIPLIKQQQELYPNDVKFLQIRGRAAAVLKDSATVADMRDREDRADYVVEMEYGMKFIGSLSSRFGLGARLSRAALLKEDGSAEEQFAALTAALTIIRKHHFWNYRSVFVAMAEFYVETAQPEKAQAIIEEIRQFSQDGPELLLLEGRAFLSEGRIADAKAVWQRAKRMRPSLEIVELLESVEENPVEQRSLQAEKAFRLGLAEFSRNRVADSLPYFEKAVELNSGESIYQYYLADAFRLTGSLDEAESGFKKCLQLRPEHGRALTRLRMLSN